MNVCGAPDGRQRHRGDQLVRLERVPLHARDELAERDAPRAAHGRALDLGALDAASGGSASPAGDAVPRLPPIVPRLRICGEPTVRDASASAGSSAGELAAPSPRCRSARRRAAATPFSRDQPRSSATSFRLSSAAGRARSKLSATITSVPPWIGSALGVLRPQPQRLVEGARGEDVHGANCTVPVQWPHRSRAASPSRAETSPPTSSCAAAGCSRVFTREWLETDVAIVDGYVAGLGEYEGVETLDADGRYVVPGLRRRAHAPRVVEAARRRVRAARAAVRDDGGRRRPARDRERARHRRRPLAARRLRPDPARRLVHGLVVRAGVELRVAAARADRPATSTRCCAAAA